MMHAEELEGRSVEKYGKAEQLQDTRKALLQQAKPL